MKKKSSYEGLQGNIRGLKTPGIEVWKNQYPESRYTVYIDIPEFTCICPKTGLPDLATIVIKYVPDRHCIELKSLKYYTFCCRDVGIVSESVVRKMRGAFSFVTLM